MPARDEARELVQRTDGDNAMYRAAFDVARNGIAVVALDGRFIEVNAAFSRIMGYSSVELQQLYFQSLTHPDDLETGLARRRRSSPGRRALMSWRSATSTNPVMSSGSGSSSP